MRRTWLLLPLLGLAVEATFPARARAELTPGEFRSVQTREGAVMREKPRAMAKEVARLPYGTQVKVEDVETYWAKVFGPGDVAGWVRAGELVPPPSLTGPGAYGPTAAKVESADVTAAGRQFDAKTERTYKLMNTTVAAAYAIVDKIEGEKLPDADLLTFAVEGRLGGTDQVDTGIQKYSRLRLQGSTGDGAVEVVSRGTDTPFEPTPQSDMDFVDRLGKELSPEQEYWLGRSVAAAAIAEHGLDPDAKRQALVKRVGATIVRFADRLPGTHGNWHFAVLNDETPNGISGPGGFVFVTKGAIALARNEDEVAGIIAHEMAHVALKHGESILRRMKEFQARLDELREKVIHPQPGPDGCNICGDVAKMLGEGSANLVKTLDVEGYGRDYERQADWDGSLYLCEVGYRSTAIAEYLELIPSREAAQWTTHPSSSDRIEWLRPIVFRNGCEIDSDAGAQARLPRFQALGGPVKAPPRKPPTR
jgi:hypothetical protein